MSVSDPKVALVYDRVNSIGGAERVLQLLHKIWPEAPLYTSVYDTTVARWADDMEVIPSYLQLIPFIRTHHRLFAWLMPSAFESLNLQSYDIVISVTSAEAKGVITSDSTLHVCYLLTPTRYLWSHHWFYLKQGLVRKNQLVQAVTLFLSSQLRRWDFYAAQRPDVIIPISEYIAKRVRTYYRREPEKVIYPPVTSLPTIIAETSLPEKFYLVVSRLVAYKRVDLAVAACNKLEVPLVIVGDGPERKTLERSAQNNIMFLGKVTDKKLAQLYQQTDAVIFPSDEDFGIVCLEAQQQGKPVVAFKCGGATEIIQNHTTGVFFEQQTVESLVASLKKLKTLSISQEACRKNAARFAQDRFTTTFKKQVEEAWKAHQKTVE